VVYSSGNTGTNGSSRVNLHYNVSNNFVYRTERKNFAEEKERLKEVDSMTIPLKMMKHSSSTLKGSVL